MLEELLHRLHHADYWRKPYSQWSVNTWDQFYFEQYPNGPKQLSHRDLGRELRILVKNLDIKTRKGQKVLELIHELKELKVSILHILRNIKILTGVVS